VVSAELTAVDLKAVKLTDGAVSSLSVLEVDVAESSGATCVCVVCAEGDMYVCTVIEYTCTYIRSYSACIERTTTIRLVVKTISGFSQVSVP
jgi:hypothetical protein